MYKSFYSETAPNRNKHVSFKQVWRKAVEKYSPKKSQKLNEVSYRFQSKLKELSKKNPAAALDDDDSDDVQFPSVARHTMPTRADTKS